MTEIDENSVKGLYAIKTSSDFVNFLFRSDLDAPWERAFTLQQRDYLDLQTTLVATLPDEKALITALGFRRGFLWKTIDYPPNKREGYLYRFLSLSHDSIHYWYNLVSLDTVYPYATVALTILLDYNTPEPPKTDS